MKTKIPKVGDEIVVRLNMNNVEHRGTYMGIMNSLLGDRYIVFDWRGPMVVFNVWRYVDGTEWFQIGEK